MRIMLTGADGQLGSELRMVLERGKAHIGPVPESFTTYELDCVNHQTLDIADEEALDAWFASHEPYDAVINCAAFTNVDGCETQEDLAYAVNGRAPGLLAAQAAASGAAFVHVSTDYVFPGTDPTPRREDDETGPASAYGRTKLAGEQAVLKAYPEAIIVRVAWLYGLQGKNFVKTMLKLGASHDAVTVVDDQLGNPTYANDVVYELLKLVDAGESGIFHCTNEGICSWADLAQAVMEGAELPCTVNRCTSAEYKEMNPNSADRPAFSALENARLAQTVGNEMRPWREALASFLSELSA